MNATTLPGPGRFIPPDELQALRRSPLEAMQRATERYGGLFEYPVGFWKVMVVSEPEAVQHILVTNQKAWSKDTFQYNLLGGVVGNGLLTNHGPSWIAHRRLMQPAFHRDHLAAFANAMVAATQRLIARWEPLADAGTPVDIDAAMLGLTLEIVGQTLFSADLSDGADALTHAVLETLDYVVYRAKTPIAPPRWLPTPRNRRFGRALTELDAAVYALIAARRAHGGPDDLLGMLMAARDAETGVALSDTELRDELLTLIIAGHETVASALVWAWHLLADAPDWADALAAEADAVWSGRAPTAADLPRLSVARRCFDESLRLYPPAWLMTRTSVEADEIGGYVVPAGTLAVLSPYVTQRSADLWPDPERFDPNRFLPDAVATRPKFAYYPFGGGPHLCIGNHFALMEGTLILTLLGQRFRLCHASDARVHVEPLVTLRPRGGLWMRVERRRG